MAYPYYPNNQYYMQNMQDLQNMREKIDRQMQQMQQLNQNQMQQQPTPTNLTQNFQLAPNPVNNELESKYVNNIDEVKGIFVMKTGVFLNKELNTLWIKNTNGDIRTFELNELVEIDPKDREIAMLKQELEKMKEMISNESNGNNSDNDGADESKKSARIPVRKQSNAK
jgi:hypothetical protein